MPYTQIAIAHGIMLKEDGSMSFVFVDILNEAISLANAGLVDLIIVAGGKTRPEFPAEAEVAKKYLCDHVTVPVLVEVESVTSAENIRFAEREFNWIEAELEKLYVIARESAMPRIKFLYRRFWPDVARKAVEYVGITEGHFLWERMLERALYISARLDPRERWLLYFPKKFLRNWKPAE